MNDRGSPDSSAPRSDGRDEPSAEPMATEARQGVKGHNVRYILTVGTIGAAVAVGIAYLFFFAA